MRALVTGGSSGVGAEIVRQLRERGVEVVAPTRAEMDLESLESIIAYCTKERGPFGILVNCAAVLTDDIKKAWAVNVDAPRRLMTAYWLQLERIINVSSRDGLTSKGDAEREVYSVTKAALNAMTRSWAFRLKSKVAVNAMCPGWCRTRMGGDAAPKSAAEGATTAIWLALDAPKETTGKFFVGPGAEVPW